MTYYVYENYPTNRATVHKGSCSFCNNGRGRRTGILGLNGLWFGPFHTVDEAKRRARDTGRPSRECQICNP